MSSKCFSRREMRCLRHKIHMGLFCAFGLSALNWIFTKSLQSGEGSGEQTLTYMLAKAKAFQEKSNISFLFRFIDIYDDVCV